MRYRGFILIALCLFLSLTNRTCLAEQEVVLNKVLVTASQEQFEKDFSSIDVSETTKQVLGSVPDFMEYAPGIDIQRRFLLIPKASQVRIRGLDERRSLILLDGRPENGAGVTGGYFVDWSILSVQGLSSIHIYKGAFSARYGNTLGGVIDLLPTTIPAKPSVCVRAGYQRYDTFGASAIGTFRKGPGAMKFFAAHDETKGHLRNSQVHRNSSGLFLSYDLGGIGQVTGSVRYSEGNYHMPVENSPNTAGYDRDFPVSKGIFLTGPWLAFPSGDRHGDGSLYHKRRYELDLGLSTELNGAKAQAKLYYNDEERSDRIRSYKTGDLVLRRRTKPDRTWGWLVSLEKQLGAHHLGLGADGNYQGFGGIDNTYVKNGYFARQPLSAPPEWDATHLHGIYLDDKWCLSDDVELYLGLRYDHYHGDQSVNVVQGYNQWGAPTGFTQENVDFNMKTLSPKFGLDLGLMDNLVLHLKLARATRFPDNPAFFWYYSGYRPEVDPRVDIARKDLTYEDAWEYQAGLDLAMGSHSMARIQCYYYHVRNYLRWVYGYTPSRVVYNIDRVTLYGVEMGFSAEPAEHLFLFTNLTYQRTKKRGDVFDASNSMSEELTELPEIKANMGIEYKRSDGALAKFILRYVGSREVPYLNGADSPDGTSVFSSGFTLEEMDEYVTADFLLKYPFWNKGLKGYLTFEVLNIFNNDYEEELDVPSPGRIFSVGIEARF